MSFLLGFNNDATIHIDTPHVAITDVYKKAVVMEDAPCDIMYDREADQMVLVTPFGEVIRYLPELPAPNNRPGFRVLQRQVVITPIVDAVGDTGHLHVAVHLGEAYDFSVSLGMVHPSAWRGNLLDLGIVAELAPAECIPDGGHRQALWVYNVWMDVKEVNRHLHVSVPDYIGPKTGVTI